MNHQFYHYTITIFQKNLLVLYQLDGYMIFTFPNAHWQLCWPQGPLKLWERYSEGTRFCNSLNRGHNGC